MWKTVRILQQERSEGLMTMLKKLLRSTSSVCCRALVSTSSFPNLPWQRATGISWRVWKIRWADHVGPLRQRPRQQRPWRQPQRRSGFGQQEPRHQYSRAPTTITRSPLEENGGAASDVDFTRHCNHQSRLEEEWAGSQTRWTDTIRCCLVVVGC